MRLGLYWQVSPQILAGITPTNLEEPHPWTTKIRSWVTGIHARFSTLLLSEGCRHRANACKRTARHAGYHYIRLVASMMHITAELLDSASRLEQWKAWPKKQASADHESSRPTVLRSKSGRSLTVPQAKFAISQQKLPYPIPTGNCVTSSGPPSKRSGS
jgi:hypothetical protein